MSRQLPLTVDAHKLAKQGMSLDGFLLLANFSRISDLLVDNSGQVSVDLQFKVDTDHLHYVHGHTQGEIHVTCQRCMEPMTLLVDNQFVLGLMDNPEIAKRLPENIDPVYLDQGELNTSQMVEDELILALPLIAMHETQNCSATSLIQNAANDVNTEQSKKENPFAILKDLK